MTTDTLTSGQRSIIEAMRQCGTPLTRKEYIAVDWNDEPPDPWERRGRM